MILTQGELKYFSAWAREEWEVACYHLPAHRLQMAHGVRGAWLSLFIKAWTVESGKKDHEILDMPLPSEPVWPWSTSDEFQRRLEQATGLHADRETPAA
jgi:hypothetical protein